MPRAIPATIPVQELAEGANQPVTGSSYNAYVWWTWNNTSTASTIQYDQWYQNHWASATTTYTANINPGWDYNQVVWNQWQMAATNVQPYIALQLSEEEQKKLAWTNVRNKIVWNNRQRSTNLRRKFAERRAEELLLETLSDDQRAEYMRIQHFHVIVGDKRYRIRKGMHGNIDLIEEHNGTERVAERWFDMT